LDDIDDTLNHDDLWPERILYNFASAQHPEIWLNDTNDANNYNNTNKSGSIFFASNVHFDSSNPLDNNHCNASSAVDAKFGKFLDDFCQQAKRQQWQQWQPWPWQPIATDVATDVAAPCEREEYLFCPKRNFYKYEYNLYILTNSRKGSYKLGHKLRVSIGRQVVLKFFCAFRRWLD
jgi:hypothetical protein